MAVSACCFVSMYCLYYSSVKFQIFGTECSYFVLLGGAYCTVSSLSEVKYHIPLVLSTKCFIEFQYVDRMCVILSSESGFAKRVYETY